MRIAAILGVCLSLLVSGCDKAGPPKTVEIKDVKKQLVYRSWSDVTAEGNAVAAAMDRAFARVPSVRKGHVEDMADPVASKRMGEAVDAEMKAIEHKPEWYVAIPVGTKLTVVKYCEEGGREIVPVQSEATKGAYRTPDGNPVWVEVEWQGKRVFTVLEDPG